MLGIAARCAARTMARTPPPPSRRCESLGLDARRRSRAACGAFPACRIAWRRSAGSGARAVRQRFEGDQRRCRRKGAADLRPIFLDSRRPGRKRAASNRCGPCSANRQGLSDRRGERAISRARSERRVSLSSAAGRSRPRSTRAARDAACERSARSPSCCCRRPAPPIDQFADFEKRGDALSRARQGFAARDRKARLRRLRHGIARGTLGSSPIGGGRSTAGCSRRSALLMVLGLVLTWPAARRSRSGLHLPTFHFVNRQVLYLVPTLSLMVAASFLSPRHVRRVALCAFWRRIALVIAGALLRPGGQGRAALDLRHPAVGILEAGLRRSRRLGLLGRRRGDATFRATARASAAAGRRSCR